MSEEKQEALTVTESLFHSLVEHVEDFAIFAMDARGQVVHWNNGAQHILGFSAEEVLGRPLDRIFTAEDRAAGIPQQEFQTAAHMGRAADERWHVRKDGSRFWALGILVPIRSRHGELAGFGKFMRDRTDLKQMQEALQRQNETLAAADRAKSNFLATLAHELRNPLSVMANSAHLLRHHCGDRTQVRNEIERLERQVQQTRRLIDDLAELARTNQSKIRLNTQPLDMRTMVVEATDAASSLVAERQHSLQVSIPETPVELAADPARVQQILMNLLANAARYTPVGGKINISLSSEGREAVVRVQDSGIGIPPEQLTNIFDLFTQAHAEHSETHAGFGIGLALARALVELHGGTIQALSEGIGKGSEFIVRFPLAAGQSREKA